MSRRALHWLVLGFTTLWFGVLVPVHNRGEITLGGNETACSHHVTTPSASACHAVATDPSGPHDDCPAHEPRPKGACAVCVFIAGLDAPPPVTLIETRLGFVGATLAPTPQDPPSARITLPFHSRAPPTA